MHSEEHALAHKKSQKELFRLLKVAVRTWLKVRVHDDASAGVHSNH